ncbi:glycosyltransferase family 39 protein [bacterium]|nr:glycosyltransferase family 39 protein [bacterium]
MSTEAALEAGDAAHGGPRVGPRASVAAALVFALIAALYLSWVPGVLLVGPDTSVYMGLGRSLAHGQGYTFNFQLYAKYPPVYPLVLAGICLVGGSIWAMQAFGALSGVAALVAVYALVRAREGAWPALGVAVVAAACTWFQSHAAVLIRADVPYTMAAMVALWYAERQIRAAGWSWVRWVVAAALVVVAVYAHLSGVAVVAAVGAAALFSNARPRPVRQRLASAAIVGVLAAVAVAGWLYRGTLVHNPSANYWKHATFVPVEQTGKIPSRLDRLGRRMEEWAHTPLNLERDKVSLPVAAAMLGLLVLPGLVVGLRRPRSAAEFYVLAHFAVSYAGGGPTGNERYVIPVVPLLIYYGYLSVRFWGRALGRMVGRPRAAGVVGCVVGALVLAHGVRQRVRHKGGAAKFSPERRARDIRRCAAWELAGKAVRLAVGNSDAVVYPGSGNGWAKLHFFSRCRVGEVWYTWDVGVRALRDMRDQKCEFVFHDFTNAHSRRRLDPLLAAHPQLFARVDELNDGENHWALYRLHRDRLAPVIDELESKEQEKAVAEGSPRQQ